METHEQLLKEGVWEFPDLGVLLPIVYTVICLLLIRLYCRFTCGMCDCNTSMIGKTVIITGANSGVGKETALELAKRGAKVIMACRNLEKSRKALDEIRKSSENDNIVLKQLDLCSFESVRRFAKDILENEEKLDVLINNAGLVGSPKREITVDGCELAMQSNHLGHFLLTNLLLDLLKKSAPSRIINVASIGYWFSLINLNDLHRKTSFYSNVIVYGNSKLANILFTRELSLRLQGTGVTANSLHPGAVRTNIYNTFTGISEIILSLGMQVISKNAYEGAQTSIHLAIDPHLEKVSGKYFKDCKEARLYHCAATSDKNAKKLWKISEKDVSPRNTDDT